MKNILLEENYIMIILIWYELRIILLKSIFVNSILPSLVVFEDFTGYRDKL